MNQGTDNLSEKAGPAATAAGINSRTAGVVEGFRRIRHLVRKEFTHIFRNKQNFRLLLVAPILQLFMFGYACRLDVENVATVVVDLDRSTLSREITEAFSRSGYFHIVDHVNSYDHIDWFLITGKASLAILIPPDLERRIQGNRTAQIGILIDGVDTISAGTVSGYAQSILKRFALDIMNERTRRMQGLLYTSTIPRLIVPSFTDAGRAWFNPNLTSKEFFVPGTIVLILLALCVILTSSVLVREKETGTLEQLMVAPISRLELIVGKTIPCLIIEIICLVMIAPLGYIVFDLPFRGSVAFFLGASLLFLITASGVGVTISAFCKTQQQAILSSFMFMQPAVLLSGFAFPIQNMPEVIQYFTYLNPLRYFMTIVRGVFLKGTGWEVLWPQIIPLVAMAIFFIGLAAALFKKRTK